MATLTQIFDGIQSALTASLFAPNLVFYSFDPDKGMNYPSADQFIVIQPNSLTVKHRTFSIAPDVNYLWRCEFTIWVFVRLSTDESHRDDNYLSDQTYGSLINVDAVINTLQNYVITENSETFGYELQSAQWQTKDRNAIGWGFTRLKYQTDISSRSN